MSDSPPPSSNCHRVNCDSLNEIEEGGRQADVPQRRVSSHRPPALTLPSDPADATAQALAFIRGDDVYIRAQAIEALNQRVTVLNTADSEGALAELAKHLPVLEALWLKFAVEATIATKTDHKATLLRMALSAQASYSRTQALIAGLRQQSAGRGRVVVNDHEAGDP